MFFILSNLSFFLWRIYKEDVRINININICSNVIVQTRV
jgi:hypothetical protein